MLCKYALLLGTFWIFFFSIMVESEDTKHLYRKDQLYLTIYSISGWWLPYLKKSHWLFVTGCP